MCLLDFFLKNLFNFVFRFKKMKKKKVFNQSTINGERHKETKKVKKSEYVAQKSGDVRVQVQL